MVVAILIVIPGVIILVSPIVHALLIVMFIAMLVTVFIPTTNQFRTRDEKKYDPLILDVQRQNPFRYFTKVFNV